MTEKTSNNRRIGKKIEESILELENLSKRTLLDQILSHEKHLSLGMKTSAITSTNI